MQTFDIIEQKLAVDPFEACRTCNGQYNIITKVEKWNWKTKKIVQSLYSWIVFGILSSLLYTKVV